MLSQDMNMFQDVSFDSLYDSLLSVLKKEIDIYKELHASIIQERKILGRPSIDELYESNSRKETCILKTKMLDEVRMNIITRIVKSHGVEEEDINLSTVLSYVDDNHVEELKECQSTLRSLVRNIMELNEENKALLDTSLFYVRNSIDFINNLMSPDLTYMNTGQMKTGKMNGKMLSQEG